MATKPKVFIDRMVHYTAAPGGMITVGCQFTSDDPFYPGTLRSTNGPVTFPQPAVWTSDDQVVAAVAAMFPDADVAFFPLQAPPEPEPAPVPEPVVEEPTP